jgi:hypothetical protein
MVGFYFLHFLSVAVSYLREIRLLDGSSAICFCGENR